MDRYKYRDIPTGQVLLQDQGQGQRETGRETHRDKYMDIQTGIGIDGLEQEKGN